MAFYPLTRLAIIVALIVYFGLSLVVGRSRAKYGVPAPATAGHPEFDRRYRVHMNTLEQLALFLPAVWLGLPVLGDMITAALVLVWSLGRVLYARAYYADPTKRGPGFTISLLATVVMVVAGAYGAVSYLLI